MEQNMVITWAFLSHFTFLMFPYSFPSVFRLFLYSPVQFPLSGKVVVLNWEEWKSSGLSVLSWLFFLFLIVVGFVPLPPSTGLHCWSSEATLSLLHPLLRWYAGWGLIEYSLLFFLQGPCQSVPARHSRWLSPSQKSPWQPPLALPGCVAFIAYLHNCLAPCFTNWFSGCIPSAFPCCSTLPQLYRTWHHHYQETEIKDLFLF